MTGCDRAIEIREAGPKYLVSPSVATRENRQFACEMKFVLPANIAGQIRGWARHHLAPDPYAHDPAGDGYLITSIYFDTRHYDVFHRHGSFSRGKYRVRRYGSSEIVFLERKLRTKNFLTKRRTSILLSDLKLLESPNAAADWSGGWFERRVAARQVRPVCQVSYQRTARVGMTQFGPIRLTLDYDLRAVPVSSIGFTGEPGTPFLPARCILELKFTVAMPAMFKRLSEEFLLNPVSFSKYRAAAGALDLARSVTEQGYA